MRETDKRSVAVMALGGTIAMVKGKGGEKGGVVPTLAGEALVAAVPGLDAVADVHAQSFRQLPSAQLGYDDLDGLAAAIGQLDNGGCDGVVVTQGTDTIEETAFVLDRLLDLEMPVVVTGAMRNPTEVGADGPANLLAAVRVASSEAVRGMGCVVVFNDEIHAARFVRKTHTSRLDTFQSPACGRIGWITEDRVRVVARVPRMPVVRGPVTRNDARVALVKIALGDRGEQVRALQGAGFSALVVEATGGGHVPREVADALEAAARAMPVVLASRTGSGEVLAHTYGFPGSETDLLRRGLIRAGWLDGLKAKALLTLLLRRESRTSAQVAEAFAAWA
ncbi:MAG: asparaginase [Candidimonas sp.]|nr:MAG: asparaginase [Candidimonas sp.]